MELNKTLVFFIWWIWNEKTLIWNQRMNNQWIGMKNLEKLKKTLK